MRNIPRPFLDGVMAKPQQIVPELGNKKAYQWQVDFGSGRIFLLRAFVDETINLAVVVTVYRTSKINKYWRKT